MEATMEIQTTGGMEPDRLRQFRAEQLRESLRVQEHNAAKTRRYLNIYLRHLSPERINVLGSHYDRLMTSVYDLRRELEELGRNADSGVRDPFEVL